jgi:hypothetical protein
VIYIYRGSGVHIFQADIQLARFPLFYSFFFYMGRNDAVERYAKISHVSLERCILWNDDKMINLCSLMRCFSYDASVMHFTMPALFILKSGDNKSPCATWQILKIGKSLSALLMNSSQRTENYNENLSAVGRRNNVKPRVYRRDWQSNSYLVFRNIFIQCLLQNFTERIKITDQCVRE